LVTSRTLPSLGRYETHAELYLLTPALCGLENPRFAGLAP
jgi:hypothetical protein